MSAPDPGGDCRRFEGRVALVSGAASGLGRAAAIRLAGEGARVVVGDIRRTPKPGQPDGDRPTEEAIAGGGGEASFIEWDVRDEAQTEAAIGHARERYGRLDVVVANAGVVFPEAGSLPHESVELWHEVVAVNLTGAWHTIQLGLRALIEQGEGGRIVAISSFAGLAAVTGIPSSYVATKTGVVGLIRQAAAHGAPHGITANAVCPGTTRTPLSAEVWEDPDRLAAATAVYPIRRLGEAFDIAAAIAFFASPDAAWVTGVALPVDGGRHAIPATGGESREP